MEKRERQSNIELLRILVMLGVVVLHMNLYGLKIAAEFSGKFIFMHFTESLFICAVNVFVLITGYFSYKINKISVWKIIELIVEVILVKEALYITYSILQRTPISLSTIITNLIPNNYFVILYCVLLCMAPFIAKLFGVLCEKQLKYFVCSILIVFSFYTFLTDVLEAVSQTSFAGINSIGLYGDQQGYTIINFMLVFIVGAYLRITNVQYNLKNSIVLYMTTTMVIFLAALVSVRYSFAQISYNYNNPLVIFQAVGLFMIFKNLRIGSHKIINVLAKSSFMTYLIHPAILILIPFDKMMTLPAYLYIIISILLPIIIYLVGWLVDFIYQYVMSFITRPLDKDLYNLTINIEDLV